MAVYLLNPDQVASLFEYLQLKLDESACEDSYKYTKQWLAMHIPQQQHEAILSEMQDMFGDCDCEVLMNCYNAYEEVLYNEKDPAIAQPKAEGVNRIETYLANLQEINNMTWDDFGNRKKVTITNKLADRNRRIAADIEKRFPEQKEDFAKLLFHHNRKIRAQVAHHMLEVMHYPAEHRKKALDEIKEVVNKGTPVERLGNQMWLNKWYQDHPEDRFL